MPSRVSVPNQCRSDYTTVQTAVVRVAMSHKMTAVPNYLQIPMLYGVLCNTSFCVKSIPYKRCTTSVNAMMALCRAITVPAAKH